MLSYSVCSNYPTQGLLITCFKHTAEWMIRWGPGGASLIRITFVLGFLHLYIHWGFCALYFGTSVPCILGFCVLDIGTSVPHILGLLCPCISGLLWLLTHRKKEYYHHITESEVRKFIFCKDRFNGSTTVLNNITLFGLKILLTFWGCL